MNLYEEQRKLEQEATAAGYRRFEKRLRKAEEAGRTAEEGGGKKLLREALINVALGIGKVCNDAGERGPAPPIVKWSNAIGHDVTAYLALKGVMNVVLNANRNHGASADTPLNLVAHNITRLLKDQLRMQIFKAKSPGLYHYKMNHFNSSNYAHRLRSMRATMKWAEIEDHDLIKPGHELRLGIQLLDVVMETTGLVDYRRVRKGKDKYELVVYPTPKTVDWIAKRNMHLALLEPIFKPMVIPPATWGKGDPGGYWFEQYGKIPLLRGRAGVRNNRIVHNYVDMPEVYSALNAVQETAWAINNYVLKAAEYLQVGGRERAGILTFREEVVPPKPFDIDTNREAKRNWKYQAKLVHDRNARRRMKVIEQARCIATAQSVCQYEEVYFPHSLDFRGRLYPAVPYLSPQGDDLSRGLLMFAHGKELNGSGKRHLAVHGANCMAEHNGVKLDKATIEERVAWVHKHSDAIVRCGNDFESDTFWEQSDKPLQFLAFCFEWAQLKNCETQGRRFISHLPVAQDGTCNGLQHYAAMTHDGEMGRCVNLVPGDRPADIYQEVCDAVEETLNDACHDGEELACQWLLSGLVTRSLVKRPVMTYPYGTNVYGITDTLRDDLPSTGDAPDQKKAFRYMAQTIWNAMVQKVRGAYLVMQYLQQTVREVLKQRDAPIVWVTPLGFPVIQTYHNYTCRQINTELAGAPIYPSVYFDTAGVIKHRHVNGIAPNFVHSLDATALNMTVNAAVRAGITEFGMIHDSYATLAADAGTMADMIRAQFHRLYTEYKPLLDWQEDIEEQSQGKVASVWNLQESGAMSGGLNLDLIFKSRYFFH